MAKMIALTEGAAVVYVNADAIRFIRQQGPHSMIYFSKDDVIGVRESPKEILSIIGKFGD